MIIKKRNLVILEELEVCKMCELIYNLYYDKINIKDCKFRQCLRIIIIINYLKEGYV